MDHSSTLAAEDDAAIRALLDRMGQAWARGDGQAYASVFSEDATDDNAPGQRVVGRPGIAASHQRVFASVLNHTRLGGGDPVRLQPVPPDVVVVHASGAVLFAGEDEAKGSAQRAADHGRGPARRPLAVRLLQRRSHGAGTQREVRVEVPGFAACGLTSTPK